MAFEYLNSSVKKYKSSNTNWGGVREGFGGVVQGWGNWVSCNPPFVLKATLNGIVCRLIKYVNMHLQTHYQSPNTQLLYSITHTMGVSY